MVSIEVDFDVWKALTAERHSETDSYSDVLRRLLGLPAQDPSGADQPVDKAWELRGATLPHGTQLRLKYRGETHRAVVENGALVYRGKRYTTPSSAACEITKTSVNGWRMWEAQFPGTSAWHTLSAIRARGGLSL